jgi:hypothetical protein
MASDSRWTGAVANREWQRGTKAAAPPIDSAYLAAQISAYLSDCYAARGVLNSDYHPTADGAVKLIPHANKEQAEQIREAFHAETATASRD